MRMLFLSITGFRCRSLDLSVFSSAAAFYTEPTALFATEGSNGVTTKEICVLAATWAMVLKGTTLEPVSTFIWSIILGSKREA